MNLNTTAVPGLQAAEGPVEKMYSYGDPLVPWINSAMPSRKTDTNNRRFSTDFVGQNHDYPEATYAEREKSLSDTAAISRD